MKEYSKWVLLLVLILAQAGVAVAENGTVIQNFPEGENTVIQLADYLSPDNASSGDQFGLAMAVHGKTLVLGVTNDDTDGAGINPIDNNLASNTGAVYIYLDTADDTEDHPNWQLQAYIKSSNPDDHDQFGYAVDIWEDTVAVSAVFEDSAGAGINGNQEDNSLSRSGAVYVLVRDSFNQWTQQAYIKSSAPDTLDNFGYTVSLWGDRLAVGVNEEDGGANTINGNRFDNSKSNAGAVYMFKRTGQFWSEEAYIKASNSDALDEFGSEVELHETTLVVGAPKERSATTGINGNESDNSAFNAGAVYVFEVDNDDNWTQQAYLKASNTEIGDFFGWTIHLSQNSLAVAAINEQSAATGVNGDQSDNSMDKSGAVYLFERDQDDWVQTAYIKSSNPGPADQFGTTIAMNDHTMLVGSPLEDSAFADDPLNDDAFASGAIYLFTKASGIWHFDEYIKRADIASSDRFGSELLSYGNHFLAQASGRNDQGQVFTFYIDDTIFFNSFE